MKRLTSKLISCLLAVCLTACCFGGFAVSADEADYIGAYPKELTAGADIRAMSFNLLADNGDGGFEWGTPLGKRADQAIDCIRYYMPDIIGIQEATVNWYTAIRARNGATYAFVNDTFKDIKYGTLSGMMYKRRALKLLDKELIVYSQYNCDRARVVNMAYFEHIATGERFVFVCTHFNAGSLDAPVRVVQATELAAKLNEYAEKYKCPVISVADYNSQKGTEPQTIITRDAAMLYSDTNPENTIDHILYRGAVTPRYFAIVDDAMVRPASDHLPIFTDFSLDNKAKANGDMDEDGEVTVTDALIALRIAAGLDAGTDRRIRIGNLDGDKKITVTDALMILRIAAKLAPEIEI